MKKIINNTKKIASTILIAISAALIAVVIYAKFVQKEPKILTQTIPYSLTNFSYSPDSNCFDFTHAAEKTVHAVVHVKTHSIIERKNSNPLYEFFYGETPSSTEPMIAFGSGVIISSDGYIVTNNHVIDNSDEIIVKLNDNREFKANLVGADPQTDIALLKIEGEDFPYISYGNSNHLKVGEWVLAVGNPYNLTSTVTAGIVSAKGRNLGILNNQYRIESFIQTDAALNSGNSGGALVNTQGMLIGINTAIISRSGAYSGNSFAVPVNIVKKVVTDIMKYGEVQRAILGVTIDNVTSDIAKEKKLDEIKGVLVTGVRENSAAKEAGIKEGDIILSVNDVAVNSTSELQEQISYHRPGVKVSVSVIRDNKMKHFEVILRNLYGNIEVINSSERIDYLGASLKELKPSDVESLNIEHGVKVDNLINGELKSAGIKEGFIITFINDKPIYNAGDVKRTIENVKGGVYIEGVYPDGTKAYFAFGK